MKTFARKSPNINFEDFQAAWKTMRAGEVFCGPMVEEFESMLAQYIGVKHVITVNMGRAAEFLALRSLNFSPGDEIIMPSYNFPIVPAIVKMLQLKPVFVDVGPDTFNINPDLIEECITDKTKAIFITHMCGHPCQMDRIIEIKNKYNLKLMEDAVHSLGAEYRNKLVGSFGDVSYFSFYVGKSLTTCMGAAVCTNNDDYYYKMREIVDGYKRLSLSRLAKAGGYAMATYFFTKPFIFGFAVYPILITLNLFNSSLLDGQTSEAVVIPDQPRHHYLTKFSNFQAAIGASQLKRYRKTISARIRNSELLSENIKDHSSIRLPITKTEVKHSFLYYSVRTADRKRFRKKLALKGVDTKKDANVACSHLEAFRPEYKHCPISEEISRNNILIPNYPSLLENDIKYIANKINETVCEIN